jgi:predicted dehydrogenase
MKPVRWGILSTANIGVEKVIPGMLKSKDIEIVAIASRDKKRAAAAAQKLGIAHSYGSYEELLADPTIEAIYNPLPNHLHVPLTLKAAKAGKHVLCEKPIAITAKEAKKLLKAPSNVLIQEAFMVRHNPQWIEIRKRIAKGEIGRVLAVHMLFSYHLVDPKNVRNLADIGGGGLLDIGCYPITLARFVLDAEPLRVTGSFDRDPKFKTDRLMSGLADFGEGRHLSFVVSTQGASYQRTVILGEFGTIEVDIPVNAPPDQPNRFTVSVTGKKPKVIEMPVVDQYQRQAEDFGRAIRKKTKAPYDVADAVQNMNILDAFFRAESSGKWEKVKK